MMDKNSREMNQIPQLIAANLQVTLDRWNLEQENHDGIETVDLTK